MKLIVYRDGRPGVIATLPGEQMLPELEELLGGETEMRALNNRLKIIARRDGEEADLPVRYVLYRLGAEPTPLHGDVVVVATRWDGVLVDADVRDLKTMEVQLRCTKDQ